MIYENEITEEELEIPKTNLMLSSFYSFRDFAYFVFKNILDPFLKSVHDCDPTTMRYFGITEDNEEEKRAEISEQIDDYTIAIKEKR